LIGTVTAGDQVFATPADYSVVACVAS
jgi:hypothetical protein